MRMFVLTAGLLALAGPGAVMAQDDCRSHIEQIEQALQSQDAGTQATSDPGTAFENVREHAELTQADREEVEGYLEAARQHAEAGDSGQCMAEVQKANSKVFAMDDSLPPPEGDTASQ
ncbi:MAG TPA: hypothetical protein VK943_17690 [Arenibaculum sp.]|nr:hypothetical protein [Arenibaculum sp.]